MQIARSLSAIIATVLIAALPLTASAQVSIGVGFTIGTPPPPLPYYTQPVAPYPNWQWQPGYWAWGPAGYYWVPGAWVGPPVVGLYWTPGYWGAGVNGAYVWNNGYFGHTGLASSILHTGPPSNSGPSDLTNAGASPSRIHTLVSGGCLPTSGATSPAMPPS